MAVVMAGAGTAIAMAGGGEPAEGPDQPITGVALTKASEAALAHTGGGTVTETEAGDEEGAYEVEVTRLDGSKVDVHLDANFAVLTSVTDTESDGN